MPDSYFRADKNWTVLRALKCADLVETPKSTVSPRAHKGQIFLTVWARWLVVCRPALWFRHRQDYFRFGPRNVGNLCGKSLPSFSAGRRLMSRQTAGLRVCRVNSPRGGVFAIFGSTERRPGRIVMPQEVEGAAGEISGRVGSTGRCALRGDRAHSVITTGNPNRHVRSMTRTPSGFYKCNARLGRSSRSVGRAEPTIWQAIAKDYNPRHRRPAIWIGYEQDNPQEESLVTQRT